MKEVCIKMGDGARIILGWGNLTGIILCNLVKEDIWSTSYTDIWSFFWRITYFSAYRIDSRESHSFNLPMSSNL